MSDTFENLRVGQRFWYNGIWYIKIREREDGMNALFTPIKRVPKYRRVEPSAIVNPKG